MDLRDKVVVVTGAGGGLGRALSLEFARLGAYVIALDLDLKEAGETAALLERTGFRCTPMQVDATNGEAVAAVAAEVVAKHGRVDVLMNCVGIGAGGRFDRFTLADWEIVIRTNLWGILVPIYAFLPYMIERRQGHIAIISSASGILASPFTAPYNTTKFALVGLGESMRSELGGYGIGVTIICPTAVKTKFMENSMTVISGAFDDKMYKLLIKQWASAYDPDKAARIMVEGIKRNRPLVILGGGIKLFYFLRRLFPRLYYGFIDNMGKVAIRMAEKG